MRIDVITLFPEMFSEALSAGLLGKAIEKGILEIVFTNPRDFVNDVHRTVDDAPYGGGPGMVMKCEPIFDAVESLQGTNSLAQVIALSPRGRCLTQDIVKELSKADDLVLICGRGRPRVARILDSDRATAPHKTMEQQHRYSIKANWAYFRVDSSVMRKK